MSGHDKIDLATIGRTKYVWCKIDTSGRDGGSMSTEKDGNPQRPPALAKQGTTNVNSTNPRVDSVLLRLHSKTYLPP